MRAINKLQVGIHSAKKKTDRKQGGFTLVELMVSMVIAMLISIAALGSARMFMATQRQSMGAGTASGNAVTTLASIKHEAEQSALGFYVDGKLPCQTFNLSIGSKSLVTNAALLPVSISNSSGALAQLDLLSADALESSAPAYFTDLTSSSDTTARLASYLPVSAGQTVMFTPMGDAGLPCTVKTVTSVDAPQAGKGSVLHFAGTGAHNQVDFSGFTYSTNSGASLLGALNWSRFAVDTAGNLVMSRPIQGGSAVLARNVVGFQVQYGVTDGVTASLDSWQYGEGSTWGVLTNALLPRVRALRIELVTRSDQPEKPDAQGNCSATTVAPTIFDRSIPVTGNWQCFRYRSSTAVMPLRNILLGNSV